MWLLIHAHHIIWWGISTYSLISKIFLHVKLGLLMEAPRFQTKWACCLCLIVSHYTMCYMFHIWIALWSQYLSYSSIQTVSHFHRHYMCFAGPVFEDADWSRWRTWWVYYVTDVRAVRVNKTVKVEDSVLWHRRLGHLGFSALSSLPLFSGISVSESLHSREVYFQAKQTYQFSESSNKTTDCFELIHIDVWGHIVWLSFVWSILFFHCRG